MHDAHMRSVSQIWGVRGQYRKRGRQETGWFPRGSFAGGGEFPIVPSTARESVAQQPSGSSQESIAGLGRDDF